MFRAAVLLLSVSAVAAGCQPVGSPTPAPNPPAATDKGPSDVHIRTPRVNVDVQGKGTGRSVDVDAGPRDR